MSEELWDIPPSWAWAKIDAAGRVVSGGTPSTKEPSFWGEEVVWFSPADLTGYRAKYIARGAKSLSLKGLSNSSAQLMPPGAVIFSSRAPIGYVAITTVEAATNQGFKSILPDEGMFNEFLYYYLKAAKHLAEERATGTTFKEISGSAFSKLPVPVAPSHEQRRIVLKIEELFSELDNGVESLTTARKQLKAYRQAVLKAAFEGKLTEDWRAKNGDKLVSPETLLSCLEKEREDRYSRALDDWQSLVAKWEANGEKGKKPAKPRRANPQPRISKESYLELPNIPVEWAWVELGHLTWSVKDGPHYSPKYEESGVPFISGGNIRPDGIDFTSAKYISRELNAELSSRCQPELGDVLYTKGGTTGIARVNTYEREFNVWVHVAVLKITETTNPFYLQHALNSPFCYSQAQKLTHGVGNQDLGLTRMVNIRLPICSPAEQDEVLRVLESKLGAAAVMEAEIEAGLARCSVLRRSILKRAFSGRLIAQDATDESASVLLERIRAGREEGDATKRRNNKNSKKEAA